MEKNIEHATNSSDFFIWMVTFSISLIGADYLAWTNKDIER